MSDDPASRSPGQKIPKPTVDILVSDPAWVSEMPDLKEAASSLVTKALSAEEVFKYALAARTAGLELGLCFAGDEFVQDLNRQYRDLDKPTNVLSFPSGFAEASIDGTSFHLGDIVLAFGVVKREAGKQQKSFADHTSHLVLHGLLHLLGFDHEAPDEAKDMEALEINLLKTFGIKNPYE